MSSTSVDWIKLVTRPDLEDHVIQKRNSYRAISGKARFHKVIDDNTTLETYLHT